MRDSHYLAMLLGVAVFCGLLLAAQGKWGLAMVLAAGAGVFALILREELTEEYERRAGVGQSVAIGGVRADE